MLPALDRRAFMRLTSATALTPLLLHGEGLALAQPALMGDRAMLLVVDVQNCFMPGGSLAVKEGDKIVPVINRVAKAFRHVAITQDWHTPDHVSFASQHPGKRPFDVVKLKYGAQVLWPDHCVQSTDGAALHKDLAIPHAQLIIRKGFRRDTDSYSAFLEADKVTSTGLAAYLRSRKIGHIYLCGLATDFCVFWSAMDARRAGLEVSVIEDACRGIDLKGSLDAAWKAMNKAGVKRLQASDVAKS